MDDCIFCKIIKGESPSHKIWENEKFLAFLAINPSMEGVTVVIPKEHYSSYLFSLPQDVLIELTLAAKKVAEILDESFDDVGRTAIVGEGMGVNHAHYKLFPLHGTKTDEWQAVTPPEINSFSDKYIGYICTHGAKLADPQVLEELAARLRQD